MRRSTWSLPDPIIGYTDCQWTVLERKSREYREVNPPRRFTTGHSVRHASCEALELGTKLRSQDRAWYEHGATKRGRDQGPSQGQGQRREQAPSPGLPTHWRQSRQSCELPFHSHPPNPSLSPSQGKAVIPVAGGLANRGDRWMGVTYNTRGPDALSFLVADIFWHSQISFSSKITIPTLRSRSIKRGEYPEHQLHDFHTG